MKPTARTVLAAMRRNPGMTLRVLKIFAAVMSLTTAAAWAHEPGESLRQWRYPAAACAATGWTMRADEGAVACEDDLGEEDDEQPQDRRVDNYALR